MPSERLQRQIDGLLDEAEAAVRALDWNTVRNRVDAVLALDPANVDARTLLDAAMRADSGSQASTPSQPAAARATSAPPLPTAFAGGRYPVRAFLGEGAKKRVYLAHDTKLDRDVAFALIKTDGLDADGIVRVRREAQAMGRLGDNAHIVTIHDTGDEAGAPFIVSQLMAGGSVEDLLAKTEGHRLPPERAMKIGEQVCQALAHAHGRGIIHRDLKPGNVWLDGDGNAALGDFGLAIAIDRSRLTMQGMMVGTVAYMPPEQALGRTPDARSDLYALGAMLYEMVCGRAPFLGDDAVGVISQHINTAPVDPSWHSPECLKPLEALILRLLAKSPDERPASAQDVAQELRHIIDRSIIDSIQPQGSEAVTDLRGLNWGFFVGRREEMDKLKEALEGALSGKGSLAMLVGEPGIGKTRLAEEFGVYAGLRGAQVLTGHCYEGESSLPYRPFVEALRQYSRSRPDAELRTQLGPGAPEIGRLVSEIRQRFPDIEEAPKLDPEAERLRLFESVTEFLHSASAAQPLVLHLDDLHWADKPSLLLLQHLAQRTARDRLLILGAYRDIELDRTHPLSEVLAALRRLPNYRRVLLRGLPQESVTDLLTVIDPSEEGAPARQALAAALYQETEGNPFFIREVLAHLVETGKIVHEGGRWVGKVTSVSELGIPEGVREVIGRRLTRLSDGCNHMLTVASTMTGGFSWEALKAIDRGAEAQLLDQLEEALAAQLIAERKGGTGLSRYDFTHALIRQTLYDELSGPRRVLLHREVGETLEQLWADQIDQHVGELGYHFYQAAPGGDVAKAVAYCRRAGDRAMALYGYDDAIGHFDRALQALELRPDGGAEAHCDLLLRRASSLWWAGQLEESRAAAGEAATLASRVGAAELLARAALTYAGEISSNLAPNLLDKRVVEYLELAVAALSEVKSALKAEVMARLSAALAFSREQEDRKVSLSDQALAMAREFGDPLALANVLCDRHWACWRPDNVKERLTLSNEIVELAEQAGVPHLAIIGRAWRVADWLELTDMPSVEDELTHHLDRVAELKSTYYTWFVTVWQATRCLMEGRLADAETTAQQALATGPVGGANAMQYFGAQLFAIRREQGRLHELEPLILATIAQNPSVPAWRCVQAAMCAEAGRIAETRTIVEALAADEFATLPRDVFYVVSLALLALACARTEDGERSRQLYDLILPYADLAVTVPGALYLGPGAFFLGRLAAVQGDWAAATGHFDHALEINERMRAPLSLCETRAEYSRMLLARAGAGDRERALALLGQAVDAAQKMGLTRIMSECLKLKVEAQGLTSSDIYTSIDAVARAVESERTEITIHPAPDGTVTIMFSDIEDSTVLTERLGDQAWQELLREHNALIREQLKAHDGYEVKTMGDGFMVAFQSAKKGLDCAIAIQRAFDNHNATDGEHVKVRIGLHAGEAIKDGDDFYGKNVILASRVAGKAVGGEVLVSSLLRQLVESSTDASLFGEPRDVELKGLAGTHTVYRIRTIG